MKIEFSDEIAKRCGVDEREALELPAIATYKMKGIHGSLAGRISGVSEFEFHGILVERGEALNYGINDLIDDIDSKELLENNGE